MQSKIFEYFFIYSVEGNSTFNDVRILRKFPNGSIEELFISNPDKMIKELGLKLKDGPKIIEEFHSEELKRARINYLLLEQELAANPTSRDLKSSLTFLDNVIGKYKVWFLSEGIKIPEEEDSISHLYEENKFPNSLIDSNKPKLKKTISSIDQKNEILDEALKFINDEIKKLEVEYIRGDVIKICANAYEQFVPAVKKKRIIKVTEYGDTIFPKIQHRFDDWTVKQFLKYLSTQISPKVSK